MTADPKPADSREELEAICLRALELRPEHRHASARELRLDLERYLAGVPEDEPVPYPHALAMLRLPDAGGAVRGTPPSGLTREEFERLYGGLHIRELEGQAPWMLERVQRHAIALPVRRN